MTLRFYNTLTKKIEDFAPLDPAGRVVTFYTCGPTVYDYAHIGNFRSFLNADVLRRTLELAGYQVRQVMNMTDVGHMTEDDVADGGGQDKMELAAARLADAKKSGKLPPGTEVNPNDPHAIADFYAHAFLGDAQTLGLKIVRDAAAHPELMPRPTKFIPQMIAMVQRLIERGHAYVASDGVVYFDVQSYEDYGSLSGNTPDRIRSGEGGRVSAETQSVKKHPADFMLWKPDAKHLMRWPSPWGEGYPGWHLECSAMAIDLLAPETGVIDIHSGGEDNIFPHHECEIAQACCATGAQHFARYWFHTRFLIVEGEKMSKSKGNFYTVRDLLAKGASPAAIRLELIKTHYRSNANFTMQGLRDSQRAVERWKRLEAWLDVHATGDGEDALSKSLEEFKRAIFSDLNVAGAIGALEAAASEYRMDDAGNGAAASMHDLAALRTMLQTLGVADLKHEADADAGDVDLAWISERLAARGIARAERNWGESDRIRDELLAKGIAIKDGADGTTWSRIVQ